MEPGWIGPDESFDGSFVDLEDRPIELAFKLYPWEWMFHDAFGLKLKEAPTRLVEPPWKAILSNKGILPLLWEMFPDANPITGNTSRFLPHAIL